MAQKVSKGRQNGYAVYKSSQRWKTNRENKLRKLIKANPNNLQLVQALKNVTYRRRTPKAEFWTKSMIRMATIIKEVCGSCPHLVFNSNPIVASDALRSVSKKDVNVVRSKNVVSFSIKDRAIFK